MNSKISGIDWDLIRSFLAVSRSGSLSAAARELGESQPTLSRDIQAIESATQLNLFQRTTQGLKLTEAGQSLVEAAMEMDAAANLFNRQASGLSQLLEGDVRISANEIIGIYLLPPAIAAFQKENPAVNIEIVISNATSSINKREADIALRMYRPTQPDLIAKRLPDLDLGFYASESYIKENGTPETMQDLSQHTMIGFDESMDFIDGASAMGYSFSRKDFPIRTDHLMAQINLARAGAGIVGTHTGLANKCAELKPVMQHIVIPALEFWIVCHHDTQFNARIRALQQFLSQWFMNNPYEQVII